MNGQHGNDRGSPSGAVGSFPRRPLAALSLSMLLSSLGTSIANVSLPTLQQAFGASFQQVQWVVLAYLLAVTTLIVSAGRLGDAVGRRRLLLAGIALFTLASALCAAAPSLTLLIAARALQGLGAAAMMALTLAMAGDIAPQGRTGAVMGMLGTMSALGTALGPVLGGLLIAQAGWPAIFVALLAPGVLALLFAWRFLPDGLPRAQAVAVRFDHCGTVLLALALGALSLSATLGRGAFGPLNAALLAMAVLAACGFLLSQSLVASPLVPLATVAHPAIAGGFVMSMLVTAVMMATLVAGPFYLAGALGLDTASVGLAMACGPALAALAGVPSGRLADRFGTPRMVGAGLALMLAGCAMLVLLTGSAGVAGYIASLAVLTAGYALFQASNNSALMWAATAEQRGLVSGLASLARNIGLIAGASAMGALFAAGAGDAAGSMPPSDALAAGMRLTFLVAGALVLASMAAGHASAAFARRAKSLACAPDA